MSMFQSRRFSIVGASVLCLVVGFAAGCLTSRATTKLPSDSCHKQYPLLSDNLDCAAVNDAADTIATLEHSVNTYIDRRKASGSVDRASVFYRDLESKRWFGVLPDDPYYPASLAKFPLALVYFKVAEIEPALFDQTLLLTEEGDFTNKGQTVSVDGRMQTGKEYSVRMMIEDMLIYSDNRPVGALTKFMRPDIWKKVYFDFGILKTSEKGEEAWGITPRILSNIFRSVYNASYLSLDHSQEMLDLLTRAEYTRGIVAGLPVGTRVAHKFGEAKLLNDDKSITPELHDCGIVYKPDAPYILCIMTEGKDFSALEETIAGVSKIVYEGQ